VLSERGRERRRGEKETIEKVFFRGGGVPLTDRGKKEERLTGFPPAAVERAAVDCTLSEGNRFGGKSRQTIMSFAGANRRGGESEKKKSLPGRGELSCLHKKGGPVVEPG